MFDNKRATNTQFDNKRLTGTQLHLLGRLCLNGPTSQTLLYRNALAACISRGYVLKVNGIVSVTEAGKEAYLKAIEN